MYFTIETDNYNVAAHASQEEAEQVEMAVHFGSKAQMEKALDGWNGNALVDLWNSLPGVTPVKKFTSRQTAIKRIWDKINTLKIVEAVETPAPKAAKQPKKAAGARQPRKATKPATESASKKDVVLAMLRSPKGATAAAIMAATGWQAHTVRGFIAGTIGAKMGLTVESSKLESGDRNYRIA